MTGQELYTKRVKETDWPIGDLCDPPIDPREAVHVLIEHFLGPDWCITMPESDDQVITAAVCEILDKYPLEQPAEKKFSKFVQKIKKYVRAIGL